MRFLTNSNVHNFCGFFVLISLVVFVSGCGGGSSSGSGGGSSSANVKGTGIRILHGAIDAAPVDLYSSAKEQKIGAAFFAENTFYSGFNTEPQTLKLVRAFSLDQTISTFTFTPEKDAKYTYLLYGNREKLGLSTNLIKDDRPEIEKGGAAVRVIHAIVGASAITATLNGQSLSDGTPFGSASPYLPLPVLSTSPFEASLSITRQADKKPLFLGTKLLEANKFYTFMITGEVDYLVAVRDFVD